VVKNKAGMTGKASEIFDLMEQRQDEETEMRNYSTSIPVPGQ